MFAMSTLAIHLFLSFNYFHLAKDQTMDIDSEKWLYFSGMCIIIIITFILSWKSKTIFNSDSDPITLN